MTRPTVSVVIPTYNSGPLVTEAVKSVLEQTHSPDEVIVIDDGSSDDTAEQMARFDPPVRYVHQPNGGVAAARNRGIAEATGDLIAFLDADDVWHPRKLEFQIATLIAHPETALMGADLYVWPAPSHPDYDHPPRHVVVSMNELLVRNHFAASTVIVRSEILRSVGGFDLSHQGTEDYDMWLRIARYGIMANLPLPLAGYRVGNPGSLSKNAARMEAGMRVILQKLETDGVFAGKPLLRRRAWGFFRYSCGYMHLKAGNRTTAARHLFLSLLGYPLPYSRADVRSPLGRIRLLAAAVRGARHSGSPSSELQ